MIRQVTPVILSPFGEADKRLAEWCIAHFSEPMLFSPMGLIHMVTFTNSLSAADFEQIRADWECAYGHTQRKIIFCRTADS